MSKRKQSTPASLARDVRVLAMLLENDIEASAALVDWFNDEMDWASDYLRKDPRE